MLSTPTPRNTRPSPEQSPYTAVGTAVDLWRSRAPEVVVSGPAGTGKSRACLEKLHFCALKYHGMRGLIVRKTRESLSEAALVTFEEKVLPAYSPLKDGARRNFRQAYHYPNRSEVVVGGLDKPGKIMSTEYDMIYVQEATELEQEDWQALTTRLRNNVIPYQQLIADCNPDAPTHWLWVRAQSPALTMLHSRHEDNPRLYYRGAWTDEGLSYLATLDRLTGTEHARLRLGQWVQASGIVYDVWTDPGNVTTDAVYLPGGGDVLWGVDDGYSGALDAATGQYTANSHPRVFGLYQLRHDGTIVRFAESYACGMLSEQHIQRVLALPYTPDQLFGLYLDVYGINRADDGAVDEAESIAPDTRLAMLRSKRPELFYPAPEYAVVDSSAAELRGRIADQGIGTYGGTHPVEEGIKVLRRFIAPDANGRRRFLVHPDCVHFRAEMVSYRYDSATGRPVKQFDHGPDEARMIAWKLRYE